MAETSAPPRRLGEQLIESGLITEEALSRALELQKRTGSRLGECLVELSLLPEQVLLRFLAKSYQTRFVSAEKLARTAISAEVLDRVPVRMAEQQALIPILFDEEGGALFLVMAEPQNLQVLEEVRLVAGVQEVHAYIALRSAVLASIRRHYYGDTTAFETLAPSPRDLVTLADSFAQATPRADSRGALDAVELARVLVGQAELRRRDMRHHAQGTAAASRAVMERMGCEAEEVEATLLAAYLHDLGKRHDRHLTLLSIAGSEEHRADARRTLKAPSRLLERVRLPARTVQILGSLYENWDGTGLPESRAREEIPLGTRVLAVADAYEDLRHNPANHTGGTRSREDALHALDVESGHLDPEVVAIFVRWARGELLVERFSGTGHRILWLDTQADPAVIQELASAGFSVQHVADLQGARGAIAAGVDLLLLDVVQDGTDGFAAAVELRGLPGAPPFVFLSRRADPAAIERGLVLGAADCLVWPSTPSLATRLSKLLADRNTPPRPIAGSLDELPMGDVLKLLAASARTGTLSVSWAAGSVEIGFVAGRIASARAGGASGDRALALLNEVQRADIRFDPLIVPVRGEMDREVEALVSDLASRAVARL